MRDSYPKPTQSLRLVHTLHSPSDGRAEDNPGNAHGSTWLTYREAAAYTGWSIGHLQNLVSAGRIPVYGRARVRRFRRDMLDLYLTNPDMAMRKFLSERNDTHGR